MLFCRPFGEGSVSGLGFDAPFFVDLSKPLLGRSIRLLALDASTYRTQRLCSVHRAGWLLNFMTRSDAMGNGSHRDEKKVKERVAGSSYLSEKEERDEPKASQQEETTTSDETK